MSTLEKILDKAIEMKASDIHLTNKIKPTIRTDGKLIALEDFQVNDQQILEKFVEELLKSDFNLNKYEKEKNFDGSFEYNNMRFRIHAYKQRGTCAVSLRLIPKQIPSLDSLNLPKVTKKFVNMKNGLILITGVTGSGKSTTLASIIGEINKRQNKHIITIEDPIEFIHEHNKSIINQREVGSDVLSFSDAVRAAMREDPDILLVGEMRDAETIANAVTMAETGHLVFGTLHTRSVAESVDRIIDVFPPSQQEQIRVQLANSLVGVMSQELLNKKGGGRVALCEVMIVDDAIRSLIREQGSPNATNDQILMGIKKTGSVSKLHHLAELVATDLVEELHAYENIKNSEIETLNRLIKVYKEERR